MSIKKLLRIETKQDHNPSPTNSDSKTPVARRTRSRKSMSAQKPTALFKEESAVEDSGKHLEKIVALETIGSGETEATTNPNTPTRGGDDETQATEATTNPNSPVRVSDAEHEETMYPDSKENNETDIHVILTPLLSTKSSTSGSSNGKARSPYIFSDTDEDNEEETQVYSKEPSRLDNSTTLPADQEAQICTLLEQELNNLENRLRKQKEERLVTVEKKLETASSEEEKDKYEIVSSNEEKEIVGTLSAEAEPKAASSVEENEDVDIDKDKSQITNAKEYPTDKRNVQQRTRFILMLLPVMFFSCYSIFLRGFGTILSYDHERSLEKAQHFFETTTRGSMEEASSTLPMEGIHVVLSENDSNLGSTIQDRFVRLGATVASIDDEGIDCSDLNSVAESVDTLINKLDRKVDFLIHTGNLCLGGGGLMTKNALESMASESAQGYNNLFAGNYLSSFLATQKILSRLEESRFGTLVQFSSPISKLVDGSKLANIDSAHRPEASVMLQQRETYFSSMLRLPIGFAYTKLAEILQHKVLSRTYPNIRTMEITNGWTNGLLLGEESADEFFDQVFRKPNEEEEFLPSSTSVGNHKIADNEDLQDDLYELSQTAVWSWIAPPTPAPIAERILGTHLVATNPSSSYFSTNTLAMVSSSTLALLAVRAKNMVSDSSSSSWFSSE